MRSAWGKRALTRERLEYWRRLLNKLDATPLVCIGLQYVDPCVPPDDRPTPVMVVLTADLEGSTDQDMIALVRQALAQMEAKGQADHHV